MIVSSKSCSVLAKTVGLICVRWIGTAIRKVGMGAERLGAKIELWAERRLSDTGGQGE